MTQRMAQYYDWQDLQPSDRDNTSHTQGVHKGELRSA
eukprot:CAMPEP_0182904432 /NCGR_PEP_ID=MMETSP0034_2-20130328/32114_1 /TAXON_ID=156128 /ORGANISM="Nephroselmis pyriformis, Strain CCMP717" /LENGTH=36 /DNA_ID= /DNA_START= /DNA_END= /DNA_ORIENTATION=